jgi:hypothetical protein
MKNSLITPSPASNASDSNALFTALSLNEQACLCGGLYQTIAFPISLTPSSHTVARPNNCWIQDAQGNCVTVNDLIRYLQWTVG